MGDRYKRLASLDGLMWIEGSPVVVEKGALLADCVRNQNLLQLKLRNIQAQPLKAVVLDIEMLDVTNSVLGKTQHSYLDLDAPNGASFGEDVPIWLDAETARGFRFSVPSVVFSDGSTWSGSSPLQEVGQPVALESLGDLEEQFVRQIARLNASVAPQVLPTEHDGLWQCTCGAMNDASQAVCSACGLDHDEQQAVADRRYLEAQDVAYREQQGVLAERTRQEVDEAHKLLGRL